ncbi:MAG TPA: NAD-dependent succinate-semialdehyde dehydrogenase [Geminicoccaceae bacterium]|nr:NAD-dependent succinate-semialdehyde dehydrogenase [Geminicoccaceae bacterium]
MHDNLALDLHIGGEWRPAQSGARYDLIDPATEEPVGTAPQAGRADTEAAIAAAHEAFLSWRRTPPWERAKLLRKVAALLAERSELVARRLTLEVGKPLAQSRGEVQMAVETIDWFADEARRIYGQYLEGRNAGQRFLVMHQPVGVVAAFTAWNFPVVLVARKLAPALAAGCTIVCRPAEEGTGAVAELIRCCIDAGVPPGVVNLLTGAPGEISEAVMDSDLVRKVTFTGSIPVGQHLMRRAADTVKRMSMELGGHAPVIVHEDVDVAGGAKAAALAKYRNAGQVCVSPTRFFVHASHADAFADHFVGAVSRMKVGNGFDADTDMGPLISRRRLEHVESMTASTLEEGARLLTGGKRPAGLNRGWYFEPTAFMDVQDDARIFNEEPFGPLAPMTTFESFDEVIARANRLPVGLAGYVFTQSLRRAQETMEALEVGIVGVNNFQAATAEAPFGGVQHSGFGRENGAQGVLDYLDVKFANVVLP